MKKTMKTGRAAVSGFCCALRERLSEVMHSEWFVRAMTAGRM